MIQYIGRQDEDPMNLKHMKMLRVAMMVVSTWPDHAVKEERHSINTYTIFLFLEASGIIMGQVLYLIDWFEQLSFLVLGNLYITLFLTVLLSIRLVYVFYKKYGDLFRRFVAEYHFCHYRNKDEHAEVIFKKVDTVSSYFVIYMIVLGLMGAITFNLAPLYDNYQAGNLRHDRPENVTLVYSVLYQYPGFKQNNHFLLTSIYNVWLSFVCAFGVTMTDVFLCVVVFQTIGHIMYLRTSLQLFPRPMKVTYRGEHPYQKSNIIVVETVKNFNDQENAMIKKKLVACIEYHRMIVSFTREINEFFGPLLAINYLFHLLTLSILMVECMQGIDAIVRYGPLTAMALAQLSQLSIIFEIVHSESLKVIDEVYSMPWESMNLSNQKSLSILLHRVQTPITVTVMGMTGVGVRTMGSILKTTLSYCAVLKSLDNKF